MGRFATAQSGVEPCGLRIGGLIVKPETVVAWHRAAFRLFWTWKAQGLEAELLPGRCVAENQDDLSFQAKYEI